MNAATLRVHIARQCPGKNQLRTTRSLTHLQDLPISVHNMPPKEPTVKEAGQDSTETSDIQTSRSGSRISSNKDCPPQASVQTKDSGASSNNHTGNSSTQSTQHFNHSYNPNSTVHRRLNTGVGQNSIHNTATSTRPSYLNSQWRTHSSQQTPPTTDTEDLTQALEKLTTEDKQQDTVTTTKPTKSRWRTAKPSSNQQTSSNPTTTSTKTPPTNFNPKASPFHIKAQTGPRWSPRQKGTATGLYSFSAPWTRH